MSKCAVAIISKPFVFETLGRNLEKKLKTSSSKNYKAFTVTPNHLAGRKNHVLPDTPKTLSP